MLTQIIDRFCKRGVVTKFTFISTMLASALLLFVLITQTLFAAYYIKARTEDDARVFAALSSSILEHYLDSGDLNEITLYTKDMIINNNDLVMAVRISDSSGTVLAEKTNPELTAYKNFDDCRPDSDSVFTTREIYRNKKSIGSISLIMSFKKHKLSLAKFFGALILILVFAVALFSFFVTYFSRRVILRPLNYILALVKSYDQNKSSFVIPEISPIEFKEISLALQNAYSEIAARDLALKNHAETLEEKIIQRTAELDQKRLQLVNASRLAALGEISAGVAHEINNPLAAISAYAYLIQKNIDTSFDYEKVKMSLEKIVAMVNRISKIVNGLKSFAREGSTDEKEFFFVTHLFQEITDLYSIKLKNKNVDLTVSVADETIQLYGRIVQLSQVLINIINNSVDAVEHSKEKWINIYVDRMNSDGLQSKIQIKIVDSGPGVPRSVVDKIMQPFFTTKDVGKGTGLGLSISLGIIKDHGGDLQYLPDEKYTTFVITLPESRN